MTKLAIGTVKFGMSYGVNSGRIHPKEVGRILQYARGQNIDTLDTATCYGESEQVLGDSQTHGMNIVTKTRDFSADIIGNNDARLLADDFSNSLANLQREGVYALLIHRADDLLKPGSDKIYRQLLELKGEGVVEKIGVSIYTHDQLQKVVESFDIDIIQIPINVLDYRLMAKNSLTFLQGKNIEIHARSIFLQGVLLMNKDDRPKQFDRWGRIWKIWNEWLFDNNITALEASVRSVINLKEVSKVVVGVDSKFQLEEIVSASSGVLPPVPEELHLYDDDLLNPSHWQAL